MFKFKWVEDDRDKKILYEKSFGNNIKRRRDFVIDWEKNLDWTGNPFTDTILSPISVFKAGRDNEIKVLNKFIIQEKKFGIIKGNQGIGKSFLLKWLEEELKSYNKFNIFFYDAKSSNNKHLVKLLIKHFSSFTVFVNPENVLELIKDNISKSKKIIFLIDNADNLSKESLLLMEKINTMQNISIIFTITNEIETKSFDHDEININLKHFEADELKQMIIKRIEYFNGVDIEPFNTIQIKTLAKKASYNPREMLKLCNEKAVEISLQKRDSINPFDTLEIYDVDEDESEEKLPDGILEGDMIIQEIVGEINIDHFVEDKKKEKKSKKKK